MIEWTRDPRTTVAAPAGSENSLCMARSSCVSGSLRDAANRNEPRPARRHHILQLNIFSTNV